MTIQEDLTRIRNEAGEKAAEAERLEKLLQAYPDLQVYRGRWNKVAYFSKSVNGQATQHDQRHNCGCCSDSPLEIWPYAETPLGKVYSDPPCFTVGERCEFGDHPYGGWAGKMREAGIPEVTIEAVQAHFDACAASARALLDETYGESDDG